MSKNFLERLKIKQATAEAEARNKKQVNQRRIDAVRAIRESKKAGDSKRLGTGKYMRAYSTTNPNKVKKMYMGGAKTDYPTERNLRNRVAVMEKLGDLGSPSEVVKTGRQTYLVQEKAKLPFKSNSEIVETQRAIINKASSEGIDLYDIHSNNIGVRDGKEVLIDAGTADFYNPKKAQDISKDLTIKKSTAGKLRRVLPMLGPMGYLSTLFSSDPAAAATGSEVMGYDRSFEPDTVEYQKRMAAERLVEAIKNRRK